MKLVYGSPSSILWLCFGKKSSGQEMQSEIKHLKCLINIKGINLAMTKTSLERHWICKCRVTRTQLIASFYPTKKWRPNHSKEYTINQLWPFALWLNHCPNFILIETQPSTSRISIMCKENPEYTPVMHHTVTDEPSLQEWVPFHWPRETTSISYQTNHQWFPLDRISKLPHKCTGSTGQPQQELWNGREVSDCRHPTPPTKKKILRKKPLPRSWKECNSI